MSSSLGWFLAGIAVVGALLWAYNNGVFDELLERPAPESVAVAPAATSPPPPTAAPAQEPPSPTPEAEEIVPTATHTPLASPLPPHVPTATPTATPVPSTPTPIPTPTPATSPPPTRTAPAAPRVTPTPTATPIVPTATPTHTPTPSPSPTPTPAPFEEHASGYQFIVPPLVRDEMAAHIFTFTNAERARAGLAPLHHDPAISEIAHSHSQDMLDQQTLSHLLRGEGPTERALKAGYDCRAYHSDGSYSLRPQREHRQAPPHQAVPRPSGRTAPRDLRARLGGYGPGDRDGMDELRRPQGEHPRPRQQEIRRGNGCAPISPALLPIRGGLGNDELLTVPGGVEDAA